MNISLCTVIQCHGNIIQRLVFPDCQLRELGKRLDQDVTRITYYAMVMVFCTIGTQLTAVSSN